MKSDSILITGGDGVLASYMDFGLRMSRAELDVTDLSSVRDTCKSHRPQVIVHLAASADLAWCEEHSAQAYFINAVGTYNMALAAREVGAKLIYISTSGVFDGKKNTPYTEIDTPNPINVYGHSKYVGELAVQGILDSYVIVRTAWLFGGGPLKDKKFVGKLLSQLTQGTATRVVTDRRGTPTYAKDLAKTLKQMLGADMQGIYHIGNEGSPTRYEVAVAALASAGSQAKVEAISSKEFPMAYVSGENESIVSTAGMVLRPWQDALEEYIRTEWAASV